MERRLLPLPRNGSLSFEVRQELMGTLMAATQAIEEARRLLAGAELGLLRLAEVLRLGEEERNSPEQSPLSLGE